MCNAKLRVVSWHCASLHNTNFMKPDGKSRNLNVNAQDLERVIKQTESMFFHTRKYICTKDFDVQKFHLGYKLI